ncbi:hypothetical protein [Bacillus sp. FJAT-28004]|uniref:hypothetical protein n=1 Tax=Bacillus sp. FJAT-28004 TaxID=1679165 RepID=UPI0006B40E1B|nr:hypothetical protein [Bacillus sp. FJAT-28004]
MHYKIRRFIACLLLLIIAFGSVPISPAIAADNLTKTINLFNSSDRFSSVASKSNFTVDIASSIPAGYKLKTFEVLKDVADGSGNVSRKSQGKYGAGNPVNNKITFPSFNGALVNVTNAGYTSNMYAELSPSGGGKAWRFTVKGGVYTVSPSSSSDCWVGGSAKCTGILGSTDEYGKTIPIDKARDANGWFLAISDGFAGPTTYNYGGESVGKSDLVPNTVRITEALPEGDQKYIRVHDYGNILGGNNDAHLTIAIKMTIGNSSMGMNGSRLRYDYSTMTKWKAKTYLYGGEVKLTLEKLPEPTTPVVTCDCTVNPKDVTFANKDVLVESKLTVNLAQNGGKTVKNWTLYGKAKDGSQLVTLTSQYVGKSTFTHTFDFKIPASKLTSVGSYTETWVMRARVYFTDGTSAEEFVECTTTVTKAGATPAPTPSGSPSPSATPEPTPEPTMAPILAKAVFNPPQIIVGDKSDLMNYSNGFDSFYWEFNEILAEKLPNTSDFEYYNQTYDKPGLYKATIVVSNGTETKRHSATLEVLAPNPVAVVSGITKIVEGRPFPYPYHLNNSYTPLESKGVTIDKTKSEMRYKKVGDASYITGFPTTNNLSVGDYVLEGKVYDSLGNVSEWGTLNVEVIPDQPPTVSLVSPEESYRNNAVTIFVDAESPEGDKLSFLYLEERYDQDNDGNFEEEAWKVLYDGAYKNTHSVTYTTVGKRQYRAKVTEEFGMFGVSNISTTDILNYAPSVDFKAIGQTNQPEEGGSPPLIRYSGDSIFRSWVVKKPYVGGNGGKIGWKSDPTNIFTKNAIFANFHVGYPDSGNGANSRTKYQLAPDIVGKRSWTAPNGYNLIEQIFAGNRIYLSKQNYDTPINTFDISERDSVTGVEKRTFRINPNIPYVGLMAVGPDEVFYFSDGGHTAANSYSSRILKYDNNGNYLGDIIINSRKTSPKGDGMGVGIKYIEISPDGQFMYVAQFFAYYVPDDVWNGYYNTELRLFKYNLKSNTLIWESEGDSRERGLLSSFNITAAPSGETYFTYTYENRYGNGMSAYQGMMYRITSDGTTTIVPVGGAGISSVSLSDDNTVAYAVSTYFSDGSKYANVMFQSYRMWGDDFKSYNAASLVTSQDDWGHSYAESAPNANPIVYSDGTVYAQGRVHSSYNMYFDKWGNTGGQKIDAGSYSANLGKMFIANGGEIIYPVIHSEARTSHNWEDPGEFTAQIYSASRKATIVETPTSGLPILTTRETSGRSTPILPDGSLYVFTNNTVIPFVPNSASGSIKEVDANTVEVTNDDWGGLIYDAATSLKNYAFEFGVSVNDPKNGKVVGAGFQIQDERNMYAVEWSNTTLSLYRVVNGVKTLLQSIPMARSPFTTYPIKVESVNGIQRVYVNYAKVIEVADGTFKKGYSGLMSLGQPNAVFSNVSKTNYGDYYVEETIDTVLVNEPIRYDKVFKDIENDPSREESWTYKHDPNFFLNPQGTSAYNGNTYPTPVLNLDKSGVYEITFKSSDNPTFASYSKWSEPTTKLVYAHRRPVAVPSVRFTGSVSSEGEGLDYDTFDGSYDLDVADGIVERVFRTRWADETTWTSGKRILYNRPNVELFIQEQVKDVHGAWSFWEQTSVYKESLPPVNQTKPVMTITTPNGTLNSPVTYLTEPLIRWNYYDAQNDPQEKYRLVLTYVDTNATIISIEYDGNNLNYQVDEGILVKGKKVKVQGKVYSKGLWSDDSNIVYFVLNTPPITTLISPKGTINNPYITNNNKPTLSVSVTDAQNNPISAVDYEVFYASTDALVVDTNASISSFSRTLANPLMEGLHYWKARAFDGYEWGNYSNVDYFFIDTVKPADVDEQLAIEPTAVTVSFNAFNDAAPSSGHATRTFYLQKVNGDGSVTNIDLNGDGTTEYSIPLALSKQSHRVTGLISGQQYRVTVLDYDIAGNEGHYAYIYFNTNRPPVAKFDYLPKPPYEGDVITLTNLSTDPDGDAMVYKWTITGPNGYYNKVFTSKNVVIPHEVTDNHPGDYQVVLSVEDIHGLKAEEDATATITVLDLKINGYVKHTDRYEELRIAYNKSVSGSPNSPRTANMFVAGEAFVLESNTTNTGTSATKATEILVVREPFDFGVLLTSKTKINWTGKMIDKTYNAKLKDGKYTFTFNGTWSNGHKESTDVIIEIKGDTQIYLNIHRQETNT